MQQDDSRADGSLWGGGGMLAAMAALRLGAAPAMFMPLLLAWSLDPPRRTSGLVCGVGFGVVAGIVAVVAFVMLVPVFDVLVPILLGLAVTALVAAWAFGTVTRDRPASST